MKHMRKHNKVVRIDGSYSLGSGDARYAPFPDVQILSLSTQFFAFGAAVRTEFDGVWEVNYQKEEEKKQREKKQSAARAKNAPLINTIIVGAIALLLMGGIVSSCLSPPYTGPDPYESDPLMDPDLYRENPWTW